MFKENDSSCQSWEVIEDNTTTDINGTNTMKSLSFMVVFRAV